MKPARATDAIGILIVLGLLTAFSGLVLPYLVLPYLAAALDFPHVGETARAAVFALLIVLMLMLWLAVGRDRTRLAALVSSLSDALPVSERPVAGTDPVQGVNAAVRALSARMSAQQDEFGAVSARERLQAYKRERMEAILEALPDAVLFLDEEGTVVACNDKIGLLAGLDAAHVMGHGLAEWPIADNVRQAVGDLLSGLETGLIGQAYFFTGEERRIGVFGRTVFALRIPDRRLGVLLLFRDVSEEWLAHKGRDEFIAHVSHELKTPLGNVSLYGEELRALVDPANAFAVECANTICDEADRMARLINNLLDISRIEAGALSLDLQRVRLHDLFEDCMENVDYAAKAKGLTTRSHIPPDMAPVHMDKSLIRVAISNLLNNAVKYNRPGGEIVLTAEEAPEGVLLAVQDTGIGIPEADLPHLFEKHYRAKDAEAESRGGHGLGLYLVKRIVDLHHGKIEVTSQHGVGSRFHVLLPTSTVLL